METQNLWPDFPTEEIKGPKAILNEQARYLAEKTKTILLGDVVTTHRSGVFNHSFYIVAPTLDGYRYKLFSVEHGATYYPLSVNWDEEEKEENAFSRNSQYFPDVFDEQTLIKYLSEILSDKRTMKIVSSLLSQSIAERADLPF